MALSGILDVALSFISPPTRPFQTAPPAQTASPLTTQPVPVNDAGPLEDSVELSPEALRVLTGDSTPIETTLPESPRRVSPAVRRAPLQSATPRSVESRDDRQQEARADEEVRRLRSNVSERFAPFASLSEQEAAGSLFSIIA